MNITFLEAITQYKEFYAAKKKGQSYRSLESRLNNIIPYFSAKKNMRDINARDYFKFQKEVENNNYSYAYKKTLHYTMVSFYNYCILFYGFDYGITKNIPQLVGNFKEDYVPKEMNFWTIEEYKKFIGVVDEFIYQILFEFLYFTGCRIGEALALNFNDIDFINGYVSITKTISKEFVNGKKIINSPKTKKSIRKILIDESLKSKLIGIQNYYSTKFYNYNNNFYVFGGVKPLAVSTIERKKNKWCELADVKKIRLHDFRHSHATMLVNANLPLKAISERLGHGDVAFTINTYVHTNFEDEKKVIHTLTFLHNLVVENKQI